MVSGWNLIEYLQTVVFGPELVCHPILCPVLENKVSLCQVHGGSRSVSHGDFIIIIYNGVKVIKWLQLAAMLASFGWC